jgi:ArsR family transcriptional regulator
MCDRFRLGSRNVDMSRESCYGGHVLEETIIDMSTPLPIAPAGPAAAQCCAPSVGLDSSLDAERIAAVAKALGEPLRVRALDVLRRSDGEVCQCELIALFGISQSLLSHHMRKLIDVGLVDVERRHKWVYYTANANAPKELSTWLS